MLSRLGILPSEKLKTGVNEMRTILLTATALLASVSIASATDLEPRYKALPSAVAEQQPTVSCFFQTETATDLLFLDGGVRPTNHGGAQTAFTKCKNPESGLYAYNWNALSFDGKPGNEVDLGLGGERKVGIFNTKWEMSWFHFVPVNGTYFINSFDARLQVGVPITVSKNLTIEPYVSPKYVRIFEFDADDFKLTSGLVTTYKLDGLWKPTLGFNAMVTKFVLSSTGRKDPIFGFDATFGVTIPDTKWSIGIGGSLTEGTIFQPHGYKTNAAGRIFANKAFDLF